MTDVGDERIYCQGLRRQHHRRLQRGRVLENGNRGPAAPLDERVSVPVVEFVVPVDARFVGEGLKVDREIARLLDRRACDVRQLRRLSHGNVDRLPFPDGTRVRIDAMCVDASFVHQLDGQRAFLVRHEGIETESRARRPHDRQRDRRCARAAANVDGTCRVDRRCVRDHTLRSAQQRMQPREVRVVGLGRPPGTPIRRRAGHRDPATGLRGSARGNRTERDGLVIPIWPCNGRLHIGIIDKCSVGDGQRIGDLPVRADGRRGDDGDQQALARRDLDGESVDTGQAAVANRELEDVGTWRVESHVRRRRGRVRKRSGARPAPHRPGVAERAWNAVVVSAAAEIGSVDDRYPGISTGVRDRRLVHTGDRDVGVPRASELGIGSRQGERVRAEGVKRRGGARQIGVRDRDAGGCAPVVGELAGRIRLAIVLGGSR